VTRAVADSPVAASIKRALLVHNENAGTDPVPRAEIEAVLRAAGIEPCYCAHGDEDLTEVLRGSFDFVISAGGDGTVADVVSQLEEIERPIGILPLGGSNNIANALCVDGDWRTIPSRWSLDASQRLDRCEADGPWGRKPFVEAVGSGVLTDAVGTVDEDPETPEEKQANGRAAFRSALARAEPFECQVATESWSWRGACLMVEVMSLPYVGSHLRLAAGALADDGLLDIILVEPDARADLLAWAANPDASTCPIPARRASRVSLTVHDRAFRVDDRSPDETLDGTTELRVLPSWVKILTPKET
jgi:diacylglycerol kinase (ATP)